MSTGQPPPPKLRPPGSPEDVRTAAGIQVTICNLVMTAGLAIIAAEAGITTFYLEHRNLQGWAEALLIAAAALAILGFVVGGQALNKLSVKGYYGDWNIFRVSNLFNVVALVNLLAAILVVCGVAFGSSPVVDRESFEMRSLEGKLQQTEAHVQTLERQVQALQQHRPTSTK